VIPFFGTLGFPGQGGVKKVEVSAFIFTFREEESFVYLMGRGGGPPSDYMFHPSCLTR